MGTAYSIIFAVLLVVVLSAGVPLDLVLTWLWEEAGLISASKARVIRWGMLLAGVLGAACGAIVALGLEAGTRWTVVGFLAGGLSTALLAVRFLQLVWVPGVWRTTRLLREWAEGSAAEAAADGGGADEGERP